MDIGRIAGFAPPPRLDPIEPQLLDALDHPVRRDILRALAAAPGPCDLAGVSRSVLSGSCTLRVMGYHAEVLERAALTELARGPASAPPRFALSERAARSEVSRTLQATQAEDRIAGFRARGRGSLAASCGVPQPRIAMRPGTGQRRTAGGS